MVGNCDNSIIPSSSTNNQWPQNQITVVDDLMASSSNTNKAMAAAAAVDSSVPLKCPRCDSSNTKFCYYNNYSLSQPRHFCKACKRYWTRGGTLRNVPVGGGCRKNKRHKRHSSSSSASAQAQIDLPLPPPPPSSSTSHIHNPLFYGGPLELSFPFSSFRVSSDDGGGGGFDGLGFSSEGNGYKNGFNLSSPFSSAADNNNNNNNNNNSIFFGSSTMASLLSSTQKFKDFQAQALMPYEDPQMPGTGKQVKAEGENRFPWNPNYSNSNPNPNSNPMDQMNSSDPSSLVWNTSSISTWFDPSTMGSSVPSLI